jgi:hypothetical protein
MLELTRNAAERARTTIGVTTQNLAVQDVIALAFHAYLFLRVSIAPDSPDATVALRLALALLVITASSLVLARGEVIRDRRARALTYRLGLFAPMVLSYFEMRVLLPALQPVLMDQRLFAIDLWLLGTTPAIWMQAWNIEPVVEWLSFFYYSHFFVLTLMLVPALFVGRGRRLQELMAGGMLVVAVGHFLYTVVPGAGPVATLAFDQPLYGAFWWSNRDTQPYRSLWPILAFVALNVIIATMFLRWHWFIDVAAGLLLAFAARGFAKAVAEREEQRGGPYDSRQPVWERV